MTIDAFRSIFSVNIYLANHIFFFVYFTGDTVILCQEETFRPQCDDHQVVYVQQAQYGRMRMSRCLIKDFGYQGCSRNVLPLVEAQCSGRRTCSLKVLDETFSVDPCHIGLRSYLEIQFTCINGRFVHVYVM